jgi:GDPmannose 4,6-dehydratase
VTRKITRALTHIKVGLQDCLYLGNLDSLRDWGHARDYVEMQWMMLQQETARDYVIATGEQHSVREFVEIAAAELGMTLRWEGTGVEEHAVDERGAIVVRVDPRYFRPSEVASLLGNPEKARRELGWTSRTTFRQLVTEMVTEDLKLAKRDLMVQKNGYETAAGFHEH